MKPSLTLVGAAASLLALLTACASGAPGTSGETSATQATTTAAASSPAESAFPASVETKFGTVTIPAEPTRIVALGWGDAETALALGAQPIAASDWLGFGGDGVGPWSAGLYQQSPEILGTLELSYEAIAALSPDLILDTRSSGDQERYDRLSQIAPTVGVPVGGDAYMTTAEQQVELVAAALGQPAAGEALIAQLTDAFAAAAAAHPEWAGLTATAATRTSEGWGAYVEGSDRVDFLERLGFTQNPQIAALPPNEGAIGFSVSLSSEQLDLFDADLIVAFPIWIESSEITDDPVWLQIPAVQAGHAVIIDGELSSAYSAATVPGNLYALEHLVPLIEAALAS
ncbi:MAG: iron-siderophore ABC transporter substrate-binding protein [Bifidobacteriaceae bacterium]|jgi:iron complex transport system substrate-binding protein|nr:iron-siderophore ABC transporter substrate-binding protein [Bifidobacteriaceae bacterium]